MGSDLGVKYFIASFIRTMGWEGHADANQPRSRKGLVMSGHLLLLPQVSDFPFPSGAVLCTFPPCPADSAAGVVPHLRQQVLERLRVLNLGACRLRQQLLLRQRPPRRGRAGSALHLDLGTAGETEQQHGGTKTQGCVRHEMTQEHIKVQSRHGVSRWTAVNSCC